MPHITIEIIYALPNEQHLIKLSVDKGTCIQQAIQQSNILNRYPEIDLKTNKVGIFSKVSKLSSPLRDGDRIEIYRNLIADPKETRIKKALKQQPRK